MKRIILGSRGSELALTQTRMVECALREAWPGIEVRVEIIRTSGDESSGPPAEPTSRKAGRKGLFTGEIERALLSGKIDVAVHSAKDLPSEEVAGVNVEATLPRAAVDDVLVSTTGATWQSLRQTATIGTGSVRREYQLRLTRPDLHVVEVRGNVPTRLRKLAASDWDGIVLARAGLERLGFDVSPGRFEYEEREYQCELLPLAGFLPAGGQGVVALQVRSNDPAAAVVAAVNHSETLLCLRAEREFLRLLNGDCDSPVGVLATAKPRSMRMRAQVFNPPSSAVLRGEVEGPADGNVETLARELMEQINDR